MKYALLDEIFSSITHGLGFLATVAGLILFLFLQLPTSDIWRIVGFSIFIGTLLCMYLFSTLFHSLIFTKAKRIFAIFDHSSIFLLIGGTYSYFLLTTMRGFTGWILLSTIWVLCIGGILFKIFFTDRLKFITVTLYLLLGWCILFFIKPFLHAVSLQTFLFLLLGGLFYSVGTIFYSSKKIPFAHSIWHLFVVLATAFHFWAIYLL